MHPLLRALFTSWEWRPLIIIVLLSLALLYGLGWFRLRRKSSRNRLATRTLLASYYAGLFILAASLMSPIDKLGGQLFFMHMIQHMLSIMIAAPLLLLANPFPFIMWGLPNAALGPASLLLVTGSAFRRVLATATRPLVAWLVFLTVYVGWHDAAMYNAALRIDWVHDVQHITFFTAAMLFWWPVIGAAPRIHGSLPGIAKVVYLIGMIPPNMLVGVTLAYATTVIYSYYESVPRIWGFSALEDQMLAGAIMWIPGSMMLIIAALIVIASMFGSKGAPVRADNWDQESNMIMPGLEHRAIQNEWRRVHAGDRTAADTP